MTDDTTTNEPTDGQQNELTDLATRLTERTTTLDTTDPVTDLTDLAPVGDTATGVSQLPRSDACRVQSRG